MSSSTNDRIDELYQAIDALEAQRSILGNAVVEASVAAIRAQLAELEEIPKEPSQQRKLATVLFTDIVGHTGLVRDLDPEDNMKIIDAALLRLAEVVEAHSGHIARYQGDGFKAVFGLPTAHESDPENAVRAGLGIIAAAHAYGKELETEWSLAGFNVRVGIDTGLVVAGGKTEAADTIKGLVVNLAARLESAAPPGGLLISHHTYQHIRGVFDVTPLEPIRAKGFDELVPVYLVKRAKPRAFRLGRRGVQGVETEMIGRERELAQLQEAYQTTTSLSQTTAITIVGEAGIGKSRLLLEFEKWLDLHQDRIRYFKARAFQQTQGIPNYLLRSMLANRFQILENDPLSVLRAKFESGIGEFLTVDSEMKAHILGMWLGFDFRDSPHIEPIATDPQQMKNRAVLYLTQFFKAIAEHQPVVILFEDIQWADRDSLDTLIELTRRHQQLPLLIVCLARPSLFDLRPGWGEKIPTHESMELSVLAEENSRALVAALLRRVNPLPQILLDLIAGRAEGNPFYAEELVKMLIDDKVITVGQERWRVEPDKLLMLDVPPTLAGVLQARLDLLTAHEKRTIQQASVIGRVFWDGALSRIDSSSLSALPAVQRKELIYAQSESAFAGTSEFTFKHALLRDVTYETVLKRLRRQYHREVAVWLAAAAEANQRTEEFAALIGEHYQLAAQMDHAADWFFRAAQQAQDAFSNETALMRYERAIDMLNQLDMDDRVAIESRQLTILRPMAKLLHRMGQWNHANQVFLQAVQLAKNVGDRSTGAYLLAELGNLQIRQSRFAEALENLSGAELIFTEIGDQNGLALVLQLRSGASAKKGDYGAALADMRLSLQIRQDIGDDLGTRFLYNNMGILAMYMNEFAEAREYLQKSLGLSQKMGDRQQIAMVLNNLGNLALARGDAGEAHGYAEEAVALARELGDVHRIAVSLHTLGDVLLVQGKYSHSRMTYQESIIIYRDLGEKHFMAEVIESIAMLEQAQARSRRALLLIGSAMSLFESIDAAPEPTHEARLNSVLQSVRQSLGDEEVNSIIAEGRAMPLEESIKLVLQEL